MGRPKQGGALSTYPKRIRNLILSLRTSNPGWGAISILVELQQIYDYSLEDLPSITSTYNFLKLSGCIAVREPKSSLPVGRCKNAKQAHQTWELDAKGTVFVEGLGYVAIINIKDAFSRKYIMAFPVLVKNGSTQPSTSHYKWALRLAFTESGLPKRIQVDKDSVFIENSSKSPFPSRLHLWLIALGIELCFIDQPPPMMNNIIERSHQTIYNQCIKGKSYKTWSSLFKNMNQRRKRLNEHYPSRSIGRKAPLQAFPKARHSGKYYAVSQEEQLIDLKKVYAFLAKGKWYRKVTGTKAVHLGGKRYALKNAIPTTTVTITFNNRRKKLIFHDVNEQELGQQPLKDFSTLALMEATTAELIAIFQRIFRTRKFPLG